MQSLLWVASSALSSEPPASPDWAPLHAEEPAPAPEPGPEPTVHLAVSAFFLSMVAAGVCLAFICSYNGGTIGMANATDCSLPADQAGEEELDMELELETDASVTKSPRVQELEL